MVSNSPNPVAADHGLRSFEHRDVHLERDFRGERVRAEMRHLGRRRPV